MLRDRGEEDVRVAMRLRLRDRHSSLTCNTPRLVVVGVSKAVARICAQDPGSEVVEQVRRPTDEGGIEAGMVLG